MTIGINLRRQVGIALANSDAAKEFCDAIDASRAAYAAVDKFAVIVHASVDAGGQGFAQLLQESVPIEIKSVTMIARGSFTGIDASNPVGMAIVDEDENVIVSLVYDNLNVPVDDGANAFGALDSVFKHVAANKAVNFILACEATAALPEMLILVRYR